MGKLVYPSDWITRATDSSQIERIEAFFSKHAYQSHRHDTFAIGRTLSGVQSFHYRGEFRHSLPGMTMVIHPDEKHDGESGSEDGFRYRMLYVEPALIQNIIQGKPLPFLDNGISQDPRLFQATNVLLQNLEYPLDILEEEDALYDLAMALCEVSGQNISNQKTYDYVSAERAREYIHATLDQNISLEELEQNIGRDRWGLSRDFRLLFGTSPHRYMTMRRLDIVKSCLSAGMPLIDAAMTAGFFDQSHMTRHFVKAFGITPARWKEISQLKSS
ncbi:AraC family transcriptional regulator (plasmid) [Acinetobacter lwoffii]|jgi:AraC-like DNA-binding protein|uniref:AraC family transcriptional regulator n=1 Tax=Acinetobacter lwoffii TaxID=28090 RepID=UPI001C5BA71A|nr:AraC family transcriptional regulator [Acinetobacter lwoffii]QXX88267.1 AraC family transcriptional regulator [Acinetobacter lwoffii]